MLRLLNRCMCATLVRFLFLWFLPYKPHPVLSTLYQPHRSYPGMCSSAFYLLLPNILWAIWFLLFILIETITLAKECEAFLLLDHIYCIFSLNPVYYPSQNQPYFSSVFVVVTVILACFLIPPLPCVTKLQNRSLHNYIWIRISRDYRPLLQVGIY